MTTEIAASETTAGAGSPEKPIPRKLKQLGKIVDSRIGGPTGLQQRIIRGDSTARASLAALRRGVGKEPGDIPEIWALTQIEVPDWAPDAPTKDELAVHTAMTLYALHQQSRNSPMHRAGVGLGRAARALTGTNEENSSARDRFNSLVTATTANELRHHLRTFVSLLRANEIPLDYAMLTDDIAQFISPGGASKVRLRWARQYYSISTGTTTQSVTAY